MKRIVPKIRMMTFEEARERKLMNRGLMLQLREGAMF
jgi:hypothetical protein